MSGIHLLQVRNLSFRYGSGSSPLFDGASLDIHPEDQIGLWADNGTGKTTLLRIITGLVTPQRMDLTLDGEPVLDEEGFRRVRRRFGFVLQNPDDQLFFPEVIADVMFGPLNIGMTEEEARKSAEEALAAMGIAHLAGSESFHLSGGQKRLVTIASILSMKPEGLLLDEPTTGLDARARANLTGVLRSLPGPRLVVSHNRDFLSAVSNRILGIRDGRLVPLA